MTKGKKGLASAALVLALLLCLAPQAQAFVEQSESFYVADYAQVLSSETEETVLQANAALEEQCQGAQIVVVTVDYLDGMYADDYAYELFNDWGVGSAEQNNGMLLLLGVQEGKGWLAYGLGLSQVLSGEQIDAWLEDTFWTDFDRGAYDAAVGNLLPVLLRWYEGYYGVSLGLPETQAAPAVPTSAPVPVPAARPTPEPEPDRGPVGSFFYSAWQIVCVLFLLLVFILLLWLFSPVLRVVFWVFRVVFWPISLFFSIFGPSDSYRHRPPPPPPHRRGPPPGGSWGGPWSPPPSGGGWSSPPSSRRPSGGGQSFGGGGRSGRSGGFPGGSRPSGRGGGGFSGGGSGRR